ncbi:hypothetical protein [Crocinitomix algicola]|uniref:hypothetical protein n=1 Tax=Crocinitomix algicola TaxID=1740263 RepID=UPI000872F7EC|nr:hypothetical protein [Crocinitomix algicola]
MKKVRIIKVVMFFGLFIFLISSCGKEENRSSKVSTLINNIDDPMLVVNFSPQSLIDKSGALDGALPFTQNMLLGFFLDDSVTGIDFENKSQIVIAKGSEFLPNFYGISSLKDEEAFIELVEVELNGKVEEKDGFKYFIKENDMYAVAWNEEFIMASNITMSMQAMMSGNMKKEGKKTVDNLINIINSTGGDQDDSYVDFLENSADIGMKINGKGLYSYLENMAMGNEEELKKSKEMIEESNGDLFISFNDGNIVFDMTSNLSDEMKEKMVLWKEGGISNDLLKYGWSSDPMFKLGYAVDVDKFISNLKAEDALMNEKDIENELEEFGLTLNQAGEILNGDILFVIDRIEVKEEVIDWGYGEPYVSHEPQPVFSIIAKIDNDELLPTLLADFNDLGNGIRQNGDAYISYKEGVFFASNDSAWTVAFQSGATKTITDKEGVLGDKPLGLFLDFNKVAAMDDMGQEKILIEMMDYLKGAGDVENASLTFQFKDTSKNALRILTEVISSLTEERPQTQEAQDIQAELEEAAM